MGELGPELVVSHGRYFVAGQNGPEMVNLDKDAIVFNHLQTKSLLEKGSSPTRGQAITNERNAVSYATGNVHGGPAMASASAALTALKQLRAMWESLIKASAKDLAGLGGSGGGGGGGSSSNKAWLTQVERWYNLMQKIDQIEKDITHQQTLRSKLSSDINKNGKAYFDSQVKELQALQQELIAQEALNISRQDYFNQRRQQLNTDRNNPFNQLYQFDEHGQLKYNDNLKITGADGKTKTGAFAFLSDLMAQDETGKAKYTAKQQYDALVAAGFSDYMKYKSDGTEIESDDYASMVEAFWNNVDAQRDEMQSLHDDIEEGNNKVLELQQQQNEILQEMRDNQMAVEEAVLAAIVDQRQRAIDKLSEEREALQESTEKYIQGLTDALNKEKDMYTQAQSQEELNKLRRQLQILLRSGGSGSEIRDLQSEIAAKEQDQYFEEQQKQIDAIQEASDKEIERLDNQIELMTETLEYEKTMGLLWGEVYDVMAKSPTDIATYIQQNNSEFWGQSPLKTSETYQNTLFETEQWAGLRDSTDKLNNVASSVSPESQKVTIADAVYGNTNGQEQWDIFTNAMYTVYGAKWATQAATYEQKFGDKIAQSADITQTASDVTSAISTLSTNIVNALNAANTNNSNSNSNNSSSNNSSSGNSSNNGSSNNGGGTSTGGNSSTGGNTSGGSTGNGNTSGGGTSNSGGTWINSGSASGWQRNGSAHWKNQLQVNSRTGHTRTIQVSRGAHYRHHSSYSPGVVTWYCVCGALVANVPTGGGGGCFVAGSKVMMADNSYKNIENILVGDMVMAYNEETMIFEPKEVLCSYAHHDTPRVINISLSNGVQLGITPGHPILTPDGWKSRDVENSLYEHEVEATQLEIGDAVLGYEDVVYVTNITEVNIPQHYDTYNISIADDHTYIVDNIIVHNAFVASAKVMGNALARGTLMGELGPELYVSKGKVHLAGAHGAEMVNLPDDAIVFNHLQSQRLMNTGRADRGTPITSELKSTGYDYLPSSAIVQSFWGNINNTMNALANGNLIIPSITNALATGNSDGVVIENAIVNMNVSKIANDYDAQRAGEQALSEMLKIARKTSAANSIRR